MDGYSEIQRHISSAHFALGPQRLLHQSGNVYKDTVTIELVTPGSKRGSTPVSVVCQKRAIQGPRLHLGTGRTWRNGRYSALALLGLPRRLTGGACPRMLRTFDKLWDRLIDYVHVRSRGIHLGRHSFCTTSRTHLCHKGTWSFRGRREMTLKIWRASRRSSDALEKAV